MKYPLSTYRLQIRAGFDLQRAAELVDYLHELGVDWVYLSPLLTAEAGSDHGYDVTDFSAVDPVRGGPEGLAALAGAAHVAGLGVLADIVPNHMGVATPVQNPWWWALLKEGRQSRYAEAFDVDWDYGGGKIRIPVLGDGGQELDRLALVPPGDAAVSGRTEPQLQYYENRFPLAPGTFEDGADARTVHERQHYELVNWRRADAELNYRRFFAVNTLAGVRVEVPWVFDESHAEVLRWIRESLVDGLRIDHPDGLADPGGYLARLAEESGGGYVLVEKILEPGESLPKGWACAGTSGYDALAQIDRLWVDPAGEAALNALDAQLRGANAAGGNAADVDAAANAAEAGANAVVAAVSWEEMIHGTKRVVADGILRSEVLRLVRLVPADAGLNDETAADALAELLACFPVYRSYLPQHGHYLEEAAQLAKQHRPELSEALTILVPRLADPAEPLAVRFQQTSGMVMAKGVEDTAFYRYTRLTSLTEVGADPSIFSLDVADFHAAMAERQRSLPHSMTTLSTHDTKRGEDVRARISVLAEVAPRWTDALHRLQALSPLNDGPLANLLWQAIIGVWPASRERLHAYAEKAAREAGNSTSWTAPDEVFEASMHALVDAAYDNAEVNDIITRLVAELKSPGRSNSLAAKLVQLTMPGVPDVYQGTELWEDSLVDPDNRRPVDFAARRRLLAELDGATAAAPAPDMPNLGQDDAGLVKLLVTSRALRLQRDRPELFTDYAALAATGDAAGHLVAFDRGGAITLATRLPVSLRKRGGWGRTTVDLPFQARDELTGKSYPAGSIGLAEVFAAYPVALLVREAGT